MADYSFPSLPVIDHAGATLNFEQLQSDLPDLKAASAPDAGVFLRLAEQAHVRLSFGISEVEWAGGTPTSKEIEITGLPGKTGGYYFLQPIGGSAFGEVMSPAVTGFKARLEDPFGSPAAGTKAKFYWLALNE